MEIPLLSQYDQILETSRSFTSRIEGLIRELLAQEGMLVHTVSSRVKSRESLYRKLQKPGRTYQSLNEVTDLCGIRIITYLKNDIERVGQIIEREFKVDALRSVDKRIKIDPSQFGYSSVHHIVRLKANRLRLREYVAFRGFVAEIQVRSIIMHAWAEVEHDLGYKSEIAVPAEHRRRFSRLAALLELADEEFQALSDTFTQYRNQLHDSFRRESASGVINGDTLRAFVQTNEMVTATEKKIAEATQSQLVTSKSPISDSAGSLAFLGVTTLEELVRHFSKWRTAIERWATVWITEGLEEDKEGPRKMAEGVSIFYLCYCLAADKGDRVLLESYLEHASIASEEGESVADAVEIAFSKFAGRKSNR